MTTMYGFPRRPVAAQRDAATLTYFHPSNYGTVSLWHRADNPAEGQVSQWNDLSGAGNHLTPPVASTTSNWHTTRDPRRLRALLCPGAYLRSSALPSSGSGSFTVVLVVARLAQGALPNPTYLWQYGTNSALQAPGLSVSNAGNLQLRSAPGTTAATSSTTLSDSVPDVLLATYNGTTYTVYHNGASAASVSVAFNAGATVGFTLGAQIGNSDNARALFYEVAAWGAHSDATTAAEINAALQAQYRTGR